VRVVRQDRTVLLVNFVTDGGDGWWVSSFTWCWEPGVPHAHLGLTSPARLTSCRLRSMSIMSLAWLDWP
jgi:hypothetical protein